jgi:predicted ATPase
MGTIKEIRTSVLGSPIRWKLRPDVNILSGINGGGKSSLLKEIAKTYEATLLSTFDEEFIPLETVQKWHGTDVKTFLDLKLALLQREYTKYQVRLYKYGSDTNRSTHAHFLSMVNRLFSETQKRVNPDKEELEFLSDSKSLPDKGISVYQLSSGEKQLLVILLTVLVQDNTPTILLLDNPEIALHFDWSEALIENIRTLNPNVQLIIATHSPDLIMKGWFDRVFELSDLLAMGDV